MLVYLISRKITDPSSLEEIIFHTMSSFSDYCSNELQQGKCFSREQNRALERKLVIFLLSISENISFNYEFNFKNNLIIFINNSPTKEFNLVSKSWMMNIKKPFLTNVWHKHSHEILVIFLAFGLILLVIFVMTKQATWIIFLLHALMFKISLCLIIKGVLHLIAMGLNLFKSIIY